MHDSTRYRDMAAKCLQAAQETCQPHYRKLQLSMAVSWLSYPCVPARAVSNFVQTAPVNERIL